jgi:TatA/E family protein of Tat protein translocase
MIGPLEIAIIVVILLVIFGASFLPRLGRAAGRGIRIGGDKGRELGAAASEKAQEVDTAGIARSAGEQLREARELRDAVKGETRPPADSGGESGPANAER